MLTDGTQNIISAMKEAGSKRIGVVTSIGAGDSEDQAPFFFKVSKLSGRDIFSSLPIRIIYDDLMDFIYHCIYLLLYRCSCGLP